MPGKDRSKSWGSTIGGMLFGTAVGLVAGGLRAYMNVWSNILSVSNGDLGLLVTLVVLGVAGNIVPVIPVACALYGAIRGGYLGYKHGFEPSKLAEAIWTERNDEAVFAEKAPNQAPGKANIDSLQKPIKKSVVAVANPQQAISQRTEAVTQQYEKARASFDSNVPLSTQMYAHSKQPSPKALIAIDPIQLKEEEVKRINELPQVKTSASLSLEKGVPTFIGKNPIAALRACENTTLQAASYDLRLPAAPDSLQKAKHFLQEAANSRPPIKIETCIIGEKSYKVKGEVLEELNKAIEVDKDRSSKIKSPKV